MSKHPGDLRDNVEMKTQIIVTPSGERLVVLAEAAYQSLLESADDAADLTSHTVFRRRLDAGEEELVPADVARRLIDGESPVRVWREHRGLSANELAEKAGLTQAFVSQIETRKRDGTVGTLRKIAEALTLTIDDLVD